MSEVICPPGGDDRLDRVLAALIEGLSRSEARRLIAAGSVFVDGRRCRIASRAVSAGARVRVETSPLPSPAAALVVLYDDDCCVAVDKPVGMATAPTRQAAAGTALEELQRQLGVERGRRLWLVHRLDRDTSGVLLFARTSAAARNLDAAFRERGVEKDYLAWVAGRVESEAGEIHARLSNRAGRAFVDPAGKAADTGFEVIERAADRTLLSLRPSTGRTHQLRVHMKHLGHPIVGDRLYGGPPGARLMLHATRLRLPHPQTGEALLIEAPPPW